MSTSDCWVTLPPETEQRVHEAVWTIYVCAEPDGQNCASGTHRHLLPHNCAALKRWHEAMDKRKSPDDPVDEPGPVVVGIPVKFDPTLLPEPPAGRVFPSRP